MRSSYGAYRDMSDYKLQANREWHEKKLEEVSTMSKGEIAEWLRFLGFTGISRYNRSLLSETLADYCSWELRLINEAIA